MLRVQLVAEFNKDSLRMLLQLTFGVVAHGGGAKISIVYESTLDPFWEALFFGVSKPTLVIQHWARRYA